MKKKKDETISPANGELQIQLKRKGSAVERLKRELKIEASLERVRARAMAMQKSDELVDTAALLFQQIKELGIQQWGNSFQLWDDDKKAVEAWTCTQGMEIQRFKIPATEDPAMINIVKGGQKGEDLYVEEMGGEALEDHYKFMYSLPVFKEILDNLAAAGITPPKFQVMYAAYFSYGYILFITHEPFPEAHDIFKRFAKVFEQTYTRFLDLQKAEAQAREAQIQLALERVRARTMAMQKSDELPETAAILFEQFKSLGQELMQMTIGIVNEADGVIEFSVTDWSGSGAGVKRAFNLSIEEPTLIKKMYAGWKENKKSIIVDLTGKELENWISYRNKMSGVTVNSADTGGRRVITSAFFSKGHLSFSTPVLPVSENIQLLERFAQVFDLTYTRFLDLKQAEELARESQIQLALERVRARTMAMQRSEEIADILGKMFEELKRLDMVLVRVLIWIFNHEEKYINWWSANAEVESTANSYKVDYNEHPVFLACLDAWQKKVPLKLYTLTGAEKDSWQDHLFNNTGLSKLPDMVQNGMRSEGTIFTTSAISNYGLLMSGSLEPLSDENTDIIQRFGRVFQQSYTRYIDVQKAEAQAREAQIQLSLERVRASAMAMHHSDELSDVLSILFEQFDILDIRPVDAHLDLFDLEKNTFSYRATGKEGKRVIAEQIVDLDSRPEWQSLAERWKKGKPDTVDFSYYPKEVIRDLMAFFPDIWASMPPEAIMIPEVDFPDGIYDALGYCKFGYLGFHHNRKTTEEENRILIRFANEFERLYQRFLDLQKAEAQAREAQIQLALERVRARTMAMQKSDELMEASNLLLQQVQSLGIPVWACGYNIWEIGEKVCTAWMSVLGAIQPSFRLPLTEHRTFIHMYESRLKAEASYVEEVSGEELADHYRYMFSLPDFKEIATKQLQGGSFPLPLSQAHHVFNFKHGNLIFLSAEAIPEAWDIFKRFTAVFEQTYTRFLDLQRAEAQAREAKIEAALENVRSRSLAMHHSNELKEVVKKVFEKMKELGFFQNNSVMIVLPKNGFKEVLHWTFNEHFETMEYNIPAFNHPVSTDSYKAWERGEKTFEIKLNKEEKDDFLYQIFTYTDYSKVPDEFKKYLYSTEAYNLFEVFENHCGLLVDTFTSVNYSEDQKDVVKRFAKVFEQAYIRFLDLQKAEAQARESQIELGLERVRARAMAMQKSDELKELVGTVYNELTKLDLVFDRCLIWVMNSEDLSSRLWMANAESQPVNFYIPHHDNPPYLAFVKAWKDRNKKWQYDLHGQVKKEWDGYVFNQTEMKHLPGPVKKNMQAIDRVMFAASFHNFGCLQTAGPEPLKEEQFDILNRFAKVFDLTYTRFNDLKQAEAQAREAQIELGLERVRARAMAMQKSDELSELVDTVFKELTKLDFALTWCIINIIDEPSMSNMVWAANPDIDKAPDSYHMKFEDYPFHHAMMKGWKQRKTKYVYVLEGTEKKIYDKYLFNETEFRKVPQAAQAASSAMEKYVVSFSFSNFGGLQTVGDVPLSDANLDILSRFGKVFDLTYTRFNDLKQAEAQARESQIQLALERVRARTMAMQKSNEMTDVAGLLFEQVSALGIKTWTAGFNVWSEDNNSYVDYITSPQGGFIEPYTVYTETAEALTDISNARKSGVEFDVQFVEGEKIKQLYLALTKLDEKQYEVMLHDGVRFPSHQYEHFVFGSKVSLMFITYEPVPEAHDIFKRLGKVFEQTYTRFLDLQKAEAQAREAKIEAALERVRSRSMGMQKSDELKEVIHVVYEQFGHLNIYIEHTGFIMDYKARDDMNIWLADKHEVPFQVTIPYFDSAHWNSFNEAKERGKDFFANKLSFEEKNQFYRDLFKLIPGVPDETKEYYFSCAGLAISTVLLDNVCLYIENFSGIPYSDEENNTLMRFGKVFQQTYTRFLDLQKAEAQAREAKVETALEKVRSRTMAMQHSDELGDVAEILFKQVKELGIHPWSTGFNIWKEGNDAYIDWITNPSGGFVEPYTVDLTTHPFFREISDAKKRGEDFHVFEISGEPLRETYALLMSFAPKQFEGFMALGFSFPRRQFNHYVFGAQVSLMFITHEPYPEAHDIFKRFGKVFEQTYTRFLDLQKAEAQARESQIEAALERVRSRTMGMQRSTDLQDTASILFSQVQALGALSFACGFNIWDGDRKAATAWMAREDGIAPPFKTSSTEDVFFHIHEAAQRGESLFVREQGGDELETHYRYMATIPVFKEVAEKMAESGVSFPSFQVMHCAFFSQGYLMFITYQPVPRAHDIFKRFAKVFEQTYTRFLDLQKAEAQALEAIKRASVDRVRAEIASMRTTNDLERITPLIWNELTTLGVPFIRCGVFIMDGEKQQIETHLSTPGGESIAAFKLPYNAPGETAEILAHWHKKELYKQHWDEKQFVEFTQNLVQQGAVTSGEKYLTENRPTDLYLHFLPFLQGMLYVGNTKPLSDDALQLVQNLADAFSTAYARYEDFNKLEAAKKQVDSTLNELQATQKQLIQSEKMASLGELTAGIAHEIQNPLNFVNNFSDVNKELLEELKEEADKGNIEEIKAIANDVINNEEKINHHGKRADAIVKNMLQHSRSSVATKELTDINKLADEYVRLSYHGLRAKDKSFNADFKTELDQSIAKINIIPQDIGRVLLNLINNAFYATNEKKKTAGENYKPLVSVLTKKINNNIEIAVTDNGKGIPASIKEKIFQPFFTTKPTGQGTGLGLSLSYDIIKAHGGEIKVESKEGEGSEFVIQLPV